MARKYSNVSKEMTLSVGIGTTDTSITVNDATGLPVAFPYVVVFEPYTANVEIVLVTAAAGNVLTVTRGQEDTSAKTHSIGAAVIHMATALDFQSAANHIEGTQDVHGVGIGSAVVGTNTTQTLTNKTIDATNNTIQNISDSSILNVAGSKITGSITTATIPADNVVGPYDNITVRQEVAGTVGLDATVHATATQPNVRVAGAVGQDALQINRNNSTTTGNLLNLRSETGTSLASISRAGNLIAGDINANGAIGALGGISTFSGISATGDITSGGNFKIGTRNVNDETVRRFATVAARSAAIPTPTVGMVTWTDEKGLAEVYSSGAWRPVSGQGSLVATSTYSQTLTTGNSADVTPWTIVSPPTEAAFFTASGANVTCVKGGHYLFWVQGVLETDIASGNIAAGRMTMILGLVSDLGPFDGFVRAGFGDGVMQWYGYVNVLPNETIGVRVFSGNTSVTFHTFQMNAFRLG